MTNKIAQPLNQLYLPGRQLHDFKQFHYIFDKSLAQTHNKLTCYITYPHIHKLYASKKLWKMFQIHGVFNLVATLHQTRLLQLEISIYVG